MLHARLNERDDDSAKESVSRLFNFRKQKNECVEAGPACSYNAGDWPVPLSR